MRFCEVCESRMEKNTDTGNIIYSCKKCVDPKPGKPEDTLMYEKSFTVNNSSLKYEVFIGNAPYDPAGKLVKKSCPQCNLDFLTMIRVGVREQVLYVCTCGFKTTHEDYKPAVATKPPKSPNNA